MMTRSGDPIQRAVGDALSGRSYRFGVHGWPERRRRRDRSRRKSARNEPYGVKDPQRFSIDEFARPENLMVAFRILCAQGGPAPGNDGLSYADFSPGEIWAALRSVSRAIIDWTYRPYRTRPKHIPKDDGNFRELQLLIITDRVVAKALQLALGPYWEPILPGIRRSVWEIYAEMEYVIRHQRRYILATDDIRDFFRSVRIGDVLRCHRQYINQSDLLRLVETIICGHEGPDRSVGLDQGSPESPPAAELMLHTCLDRELDTADPGHPPLFRYVDNLPFLCSDVREGHQILGTVKDILRPYQLTLKGKDGDPVDIRNPDHGRKVLGLIPIWERDHLSFDLPELALKDLENGLIETLRHPNPPLVAKRVVEGWIRAIGPVFTNMDARDVTVRVIDLSARLGLREISADQLVDVATLSQRQWVRVRRETQVRRGRSCQDDGNHDRSVGDVAGVRPHTTFPPARVGRTAPWREPQGSVDSTVPRERPRDRDVALGLNGHCNVATSRCSGAPPQQTIIQSDVHLYCDGSCLTARGVGGWAYLMIDSASGYRHEFADSHPHTTANRMELTAVVQGLEALRETSRVQLVTDSKYVEQGITTWLPMWIANGWRRRSRKRIANLRLWQRLANLLNHHEVNCRWVRGHTGNVDHDEVDRLAREAALRHVQPRNERSAMPHGSESR